MPPVPIRWVLSRDPVGQFTPQALLATELTISPLQMVTWFVQRWQVEVTFQEVRTHLGVETQRQWADLAIARTTLALFGLSTVVTLLAHCLSAQGEIPARSRPGTSRRPRRLPMPWPWCALACGNMPIFHYPRKTPPWYKSLACSLTA